MNAVNHKMSPVHRLRKLLRKVHIEKVCGASIAATEVVREILA